MSDFVQESELAVLSILVKNPELVFNTHFVKPFMFGSSTHSAVWNAIAELGENNSVPEYAMLIKHLDSTGKLKDAGGVEYLSYIANQNYAKDNLVEFERHIVESYKARQLKMLASQLQGDLSATAVDAVIESAKKGLDAISQLSGSDQVQDIGKVSADTWHELLDRVEHPGIRGVTTGYKHLDTITGGYNEGDLWIIGGRPGSGKSADMCNSALATAKTGTPSLIFTLEMSNVQIVERMISIETGISYSEIRLGALNKDKLQVVSDAIRYLKTLPIYIDSNVNANDAYFASITRKYHKDKNIRVAFFDYIQLGTERDDQQMMALGKFSRTAKLLSRDLKITSVLYTQLNRNVEQRDDKHPVLSDIRQSGNLEEDADIVKLLYRDEYYYPTTTKHKGLMEFILAKHRNGQTGTLFASFDGPSLRIKDKD